MKATELKAKLQRDLAAKEGALASLIEERIKLALPAHAGDQVAMLRLQDLRGDAERTRGEVKDLGQALEDVERHVVVEIAQDRLAARERLYARFGAAGTVASQRLEALDKALDGLVNAFEAARSAVDETRGLAVEMAVPMLAGIPMSMVVQRRLEANATLGFGDLRDLLEGVLAAKLNGRRRRSLRDTFAEMRSSADHRLTMVMNVDRREAALAGAPPAAAA